MARLKYNRKGRLLFTRKMRKEYTILCPMMLPIHFRLIVNVLNNCGYHFKLLTTSGPNIVQEGLKYTHNDICYPALLVTGQFIDALHSGKYDLNKTALVMTQTGGGCRASNYIHLIRKALKKAGMEQVPVLSMNLSFLEKDPGFTITLPMIRKFVAAMVYGDALMLFYNQTEAYEAEKGESSRRVKKWIDNLTGQFNRGKGLSLKEERGNLKKIADDFASVPVNRIPKVKVGVVGEIYIKYSSLGNNHLEDFLRSQNCEVNVPGLLNFGLFKVDNRLEDIRLYGGSPVKKFFCTILMNYLLKMQNLLIEAVKASPGTLRRSLTNT